LIDLEDAAVVVKNKAGKFNFKQATNLTGMLREQVLGLLIECY